MDAIDPRAVLDVASSITALENNELVVWITLARTA